MPDDAMTPPLPPDAITALAEAGAVCQTCGGVHMVSIDQFVLVLHAKRTAGIELPWCTCEGCPTCRSDPETAATVRRLWAQRQQENPR
jgi:hypothetical protein